MDEVVKKVAAAGFIGCHSGGDDGCDRFDRSGCYYSSFSVSGRPCGNARGHRRVESDGLIADALTKVGLEDLLRAIYCQRPLSEPHGKLLEEIEKLSLFDRRP
jgi:hypothetical protein